MTHPTSYDSMRILLADDNNANCLLAQTILERAGHSVMTTNNGSDAVKLTQDNSFDLIILDVLMPVMDGLEALRHIRRKETENKDVLIFGVMAFSDTDERQRYLGEGFDAVLTKPLMKGNLESALASLKNPKIGSQKSLQEVSADYVPLLNATTIEVFAQNRSQDRLRELQHHFWRSIHMKCLMIQKSLPAAIQGDSVGLSDFRRAVQAVKGASNTIGLERVTYIARNLRNAPPAEIQRLMHGFIEALQASRPVLNRALSGSWQFDSAVQMRRED